MPAFSYPPGIPALQNEGAAIINVTETLRQQFAVAGTPLGSMTQLGMIAAAVAESLSGVSQQQLLDVRQFGPWQDGVNCTATLIAALNAAGTNTVAGTPYPLGVQMPLLPDPLGGVLVSAGIGGAPIQIPTGVTLQGSGWRTHLTVDPASMTTPGANYHIFDCIGAGGQNIISGFQLDGNKANISGAIGQIGNIGMYIDSNTGAVNDVTIADVYVHDLYNQPAGESFGIFIGSTAAGQASRILIHGCRSYNHNGSGFSVSGPSGVIPYASTVDVIYVGCHGYNNSFSGFTSFQSQYNSYIGCYAVANTRAGFNIEWSDNVLVSGCVGRANGFNGARVLGGSANIHFAASSFVGNNTAANAQDGEINCSDETVGANSGFPKSVFITGCHVQPSSGSNHLAFGQSASAASTGQLSFGTADEANTFPLTGIYVDGPDIAKWSYTSNGTSDSRYAGVGLSLKVGGVGVATGHPSTWTLTNITVSAAAAGSLSVNNTNTAKTFTQTAANAATSAVSTTTFAPGRRILVHYRVKIIDFNATWEIAMNSLAKRVRINYTAGGSNDLGAWVEGDFIATIPPNFTANTVNIQTVVNTASVSAIGVDYLTVKLLPYLGAESGS